MDIKGIHIGILALCFLVWEMSISQDHIYFDHITTDDGLSQSDINCIFQDKQGFMWFGTHDGLNKYDGYGFTVYSPETKKKGTINSNLIYSIVGDKNGNLWIGTTGSGLNFFDRTTETFKEFRHEKGNPGSLGNDHVSVLYIDSKNRLWIGTNHGLNMLNLEDMAEKAVFQHFTVEQEPFITGWDGKSVYAIYEDSKGQLLVGGPGGIFKLSKDANGSNYFRSVNEVLGLPEDVTVYCLQEDKTGRLIVGTEKGLYCQIEKDSVKVKRLDEGNFNTVLLDNRNDIWGGTNNGLVHFENSPDQNFPRLMGRYSYNPRNPNGLSKNIVKSLFKDRTGIIWIGTNGGGVNKFDPERKQFRHIRKTLDATSLSYDKIRAMFEDSNGTLWVGTEGGGLNMLLQKDDGHDYLGFQHFQSIAKPFAIAEIQSGDKKVLLIGAENNPGLYQLDISDPDLVKESDIVPIETISHSVFTILRDSQNTIWIGTYGGGVYRWMPKNGNGDYEKDLFVNYTSDTNSISSDIIRNIYEDGKGNMWFATGDGLCRLSKSERYKERPKFEIYKNDFENPNSISHNYILSLFENHAGDFWVGTFGGGLNKFVPAEEGGNDYFITYTEKNGLPNNVIKGILEDDKGNLWLSTNKGLSRFNVSDGAFKNYDVDDGLQSSEFQELACLKRKSGELLFGGTNGFNAFYPENILENTIAAETVVTDFSIFNDAIAIGETIHGRTLLEKNIGDTESISLKYRENSFSFEFASLHYAAPRKNKFAYMLEGFDNDWIQTTSDKRFATYTNLEPGNYRLKVKASNNDGFWDPTPAQIKIAVMPPFWRSNLAKTFYLLLTLGLLWLFWRYTFMRTTEKHQLELEHLEKEKSEEMQRLKLEFFTNISHEFRTPLTLIKGPLEYLQKKGDKVRPEVIREQYTLMHKNTNYLLRLVNQLLDFRKISQGKMRLVVRNSNIVEFAKEVAEPFQFLAHKKGIDFRISATDKNLFSWFDHDALEKVMNNLLSNAFKFTPRNGFITVEISETNSSIDPKNSNSTEMNRSCVAIQVKDSGHGIDKVKLSNIFNRFYMEEKDSKVNKEGMGIGLSFTKDLVELHQGSIEVTSEVGEGTCFRVRLPKEKTAYLNSEEISLKEPSDSDFLVRSSEAESFAIGINDEILDEKLSSSRSRLPILLVVDDNRDIRTFIKRSFEENYLIYEAENGKEGLDIATNVIPNIILSDIIMPVMDGIEFCNLIKTQKDTSHIPLIMLTAKSSEESMLKGLQTGADDYLAKPFNMELLRVKLENLISQRNEMRKQFNRNVKVQPSEITVTSTDGQFLQNAIDIVEKHMMNTDFNVEMLVREMGMSRSNLYLKFKELTGLSSSEFIRSIRLKRAVQLFEQSDLSVKEIMYMTGFNTASYFSKCFKKQFGVVPSDYVRQIGVDNKISMN